MAKTLTVIVTCTKDKRVAVPESCKLRNIPGDSLSEKIRTWESVTKQFWSDSIRVKDLYAGDHWTTVKAFNSKYFNLDVWVCSAGLGLIHTDDYVVPYAATFSPSHPDFVAAKLTALDRTTAVSHWWNATQKLWKSRFRDRPRSIKDLMNKYPERSILIVASDNYMRAITEDVRDGLGNLIDTNQLTIVSAGSKSLKGFEQNLVPCDGRLQAVVGGAMRSLNTRVAAQIIRDSKVPPTASSLRTRYQKILDQQKPVERYTRQPLSDHEVKNFIRKQLRANPKQSHSPLLRLLRSSNLACEQKRFASLHKQVWEEFND